MNLQAHMSGQISGQVPSQGAASGQNGNPNMFPGQQLQNLHNSGDHRNTNFNFNMEADIIRMRRQIQSKIYEFLMRRRGQPSNEISKEKVADIVRRIDDSLFNDATTMDEYMNTDTLEARLRHFIGKLRTSNQSQHIQHHVNSANSGSTMMPTPGGFMPISGGMNSGSFNSSDGLMANGYQQSPIFSASSGSQMISSMGGGDGISSQMMPTPGFVNTNSETYMSMEPNGVVGYTSVGSTLVSQPMQHNQPIGGGQNRRILHNLGSHIGGGIRNGGLSGGLGMMSNYSQIVNGLGTSEAHLQVPQMLQRDGYGSSSIADSSGPGNFYSPSTSSGSMANNHNSSPLNFQAAPKTSPLVSTTNQSNLPTTQQAPIIISSIDQPAKMNFQSPNSIIENHVQPFHHQHPNPFPLQKQESQQESQPNRDLLNGKEQHLINQKRWLLLVRHARTCNAPEGKCAESHCLTVQKLYWHMEKCSLGKQCEYLRCKQTKPLVDHHKQCKNPNCPVCVDVKKFVQKQNEKTQLLENSMPNIPSLVNGSCKTYHTGDASGTSMSQPVVATPEDLQPPMKRMKIEQPSQSIDPDLENCLLPVPAAIGEPHALQGVQYEEHQPGIKMEIPSSSAQGSLNIVEMKKDNMDYAFTEMPVGDSAIISIDPAGFPKQEIVKIEKEVDPAKNGIVTKPDENIVPTKSGKPEIKGVSLTELFTPDQVREHIMGLKQWVGQSKAKAEKNQAMEHLMSENSCQLCAVEKLNFEPPPIYCTPCGARIKRNAMYYTIGSGEARQYYCNPCFNEARGDTIMVEGKPFPKSRLEKKKNDQETEEGWVQCDKCESWQHQICALFNLRRNEGGQAEYTCPNCYINEVERGERVPLPQSAVLGAKDLPRTILSDHLEQRLFKQLKQERLDRARSQGKSYDEVPGAEFLVIRVVSSVDKKLEVKQRFLEIFQEDNYPAEFSYKSKVVLLFQKIEGVEVCLFAMYVQEFGADCQQPNHRRVYLSYLDSVKYFRPEIKAVTGEALRTFVYHEILIGYLEYCKKRGFTSCYIWACPPLKGEDYILYCHPEIQKTPKSDKLREWYLSMLRKAAKEKIVVELTNLYDHFFVPNAGECKAKVTAARLPYFDGDYWPGAAEDIIYQIRQEEDGGGKPYKKGSTKKTITKRALRASGQSDLSANASKDLLLMHKLGETISPMKEDFIMVHLQHSCNHCCILMTSGNCWVCNQCKNFRLCDKCYEAEQKLEDRERHPVNNRAVHIFYQVEVTGVPPDTRDEDEILESEFFDTRQAFLGLCQGNHYQYDTLRRAKHSSMMVLYHLHNPTAPAFVTNCSICHLDIEAGQGWRCEICPDYDVCNSCYQKEGGTDHPHKLTNHPSIADRDAQNKEARQQRVIQLRKMLDLLVHASQCRSPACQYLNCRKVKRLFRHGIQCKTRSVGGCVLCRRMWYLLQLHARACKVSDCHVPRCKDLREHLRRLQQQSDSRRRAAVMEMMRQRAAEVASSS